MQIEITEQGSVLVVAVAGRMDAVSAPEFDSQIGARMDPPPAQLLLDLGALEYISSAGLRLLLQQRKTALNAGGRVLLASVSRDIRENVFDALGFSRLLTVCVNVDEARAQVGSRAD